MSKRTPGLPQRPRGFWQTPQDAVIPLIPFLPPRANYGEPCAGDGALIDGLSNLWLGGNCIWASDIEPQAPDIQTRNVFDINYEISSHVGLWITNPPWPNIGQKGDPALSIIKHLCHIAPTWALLPWDFAANGYFSRLAPFCSDIVVVGRVSWMGNGTPGKDNAAWYLFDANNRVSASVRPRCAA